MVIFGCGDEVGDSNKVGGDLGGSYGGGDRGQGPSVAMAVGAGPVETAVPLSS